MFGRKYAKWRVGAMHSCGVNRPAVKMTAFEIRAPANGVGRHVDVVGDALHRAEAYRHEARRARRRRATRRRRQSCAAGQTRRGPSAPASRHPSRADPGQQQQRQRHLVVVHRSERVDARRPREEMQRHEAGDRRPGEPRGPEDPRERQRARSASGVAKRSYDEPHDGDGGRGKGLAHVAGSAACSRSATSAECSAGPAHVPVVRPPACRPACGRTRTTSGDPFWAMFTPKKTAASDDGRARRTRRRPWPAPPAGARRTVQSHASRTGSPTPRADVGRIRNARPKKNATPA